MVNFIKSIILNFLQILIIKNVHSFSIVRILSASNNLTLDVRQFAANGREITTWDINGNANQMWSMDIDNGLKTDTIIRSLDWLGGLIDEDVMPQRVIIWGTGVNPNRRWILKQISNYYQIVNFQTKRCLTNTGRDTTSVTTECDVEGKNLNQLWDIINFSVPTETLQESEGHVANVTKVYSSKDVAIYYDNNVNKSISWIAPFTEKVWRYVKQTYGYFSGDAILYGVFHSETNLGAKFSTFDPYLKTYKNIIECGNYKNWEHVGDWNTDCIIHEISHIVEYVYNGFYGSPAREVWGNSKFSEIFRYDVYLKTGKNISDVEWMLEQFSDYPRPNSYWLRDWFIPIYYQYGGVKTINKFFELLSQLFPKSSKSVYQRDMNFGEFFHFWSGATKKNLKYLATNAFGWTDEYEKEFNQARNDFPNISY